LVICWLPANVQVSVQPLIAALPVFLIVSGLTTKPVAHWLWML
jgi:hypothetical protein